MSEIQRIAIVGTGVIGTGWALRYLANGYEVSAWDPVPGFGKRLQEDCERHWSVMERTGLASGASLSRLHIAGSMAEACAEADWVQESAPENLTIKRSLHQQIESCCAGETILASSSSGLLPSEIQSALRHPERFIIAHPFNPVYLLPLVELVPGQQTDDRVVVRAKSFQASMNMHPLVVRKEIEGYLSDRLQEALWREILHLVNDGIATTEELDDAIVYGPGLRWALMGTCLTFHLAGGEGGMRHMLEQFGPALKLPWTKLEAPELNEQLIEAMVAGTAKQADGRSIAALESLRDDCLIEIMRALKKYEVGAGQLLKRASD